jgi:predicted DNA-binding protein with PD1-like motif
MIKLLHDANGLRTFAVVFRTGEDPVAGLETFAREYDVTAASLSAIGAFRRATVAYFDWEKKDYERVPIDEQVEVLTLTGNIALKNSEPALHLHVVLGRRDGTACGGHLLDAVVRPTLEVAVVESPKHLRRRSDPETGLALIDLTG